MEREAAEHDQQSQDENEKESHLFFHFLALRANVARLRVLGSLDFFILRSLDTGIFLPFLVPVDFRSLPRLDFLMRIPLFLRATALW